MLLTYNSQHLDIYSSGALYFGDFAKLSFASHSAGAPVTPSGSTLRRFLGLGGNFNELEMKKTSPAS